jgi:hypothetical protein
MAGDLEGDGFGCDAALRFGRVEEAISPKRRSARRRRGGVLSYPSEGSARFEV